MIGGCDVHIIQGSKIDKKEAVWIEETRLKVGDASMFLDASPESYIRRPYFDCYSPKIDCLLKEFAGELAHIDPIPTGIDETDFDPKDDIRFIEQLLYEDTSSEDYSFEDINYVEGSPPDSELVSLNDHTKETSSGSTTHADNSLSEYDSFLFEIEPYQGELSSIAMKAILKELRVYVPNVLPTYLTLYQDSDFSSSDDSLGFGLEFSISFIHDPLYPV
nr:hypothetical protein [Tanacetum cinerariifolium]